MRFFQRCGCIAKAERVGLNAQSGKAESVSLWPLHTNEPYPYRLFCRLFDKEGNG